MKLKNYTPHPVNFYANPTDAEPELVILSSGVARVSSERVVVETIDVDGVPVPIGVTRFAGDVVGLPDPAPDTLYIVSALVMNALPNRTDLVVPALPVRNDSGQVIGCCGFDRLDHKPLENRKETTV
jgi:hypothetical protein